MLVSIALMIWFEEPRLLYQVVSKSQNSVNYGKEQILDKPVVLEFQLLLNYISNYILLLWYYPHIKNIELTSNSGMIRGIK